MPPPLSTAITPAFWLTVPASLGATLAEIPGDAFGKVPSGNDAGRRTSSNCVNGDVLAVACGTSLPDREPQLADCREASRLCVQQLGLDREDCLEQPVKEPFKPVRQVGTAMGPSTSTTAAGACNRIRIQRS